MLDYTKKPYQMNDTAKTLIFNQLCVGFRNQLTNSFYAIVLRLAYVKSCCNRLNDSVKSCSSVFSEESSFNWSENRGLNGETKGLRGKGCVPVNCVHIYADDVCCHFLKF